MADEPRPRAVDIDVYRRSYGRRDDPRQPDESIEGADDVFRLCADLEATRRERDGAQASVASATGAANAAIAEAAVLRTVMEAVAKCHPVFDGECALCGMCLSRHADGPEKHAADCPWRLARALPGPAARLRLYVVGERSRLYVVGERSGDPDTWSKWSEYSLVMATSAERALELADEPPGSAVAEVVPTVEGVLVRMPEPMHGEDL